MMRLSLVTTLVAAALVGSPTIAVAGSTSPPASAAAAGAASFAVDDPTDTGDAFPGDGACRTVVLTCTLRAAIEEANTSADGASISIGAFSAPIVLTAPLPGATARVAIDGRSNAIDASNMRVDGPALELCGAGSSLTSVHLYGAGIVVASGAVGTSVTDSGFYGENEQPALPVADTRRSLVGDPLAVDAPEETGDLGDTEAVGTRSSTRTASASAPLGCDTDFTGTTGITSVAPDAVIAGNIVDAQENGGIDVRGDRTVVKDNETTRNYGTGLFVQADDVRVTAHLSTSNGDEGIHATDANRLVIEDSTVDGNWLSGIVVEGGTGAAIRRVGSVGNGWSGLEVTSAAAEIADNEVSENLFRGIEALAPGAKVTGNAVSWNGYYYDRYSSGHGIVAGHDYILVEGNTVTNNSDDGVLVMGDRAVVTANTLLGNGDDGIDIEPFREVYGPDVNEGAVITANMIGPHTLSILPTDRGVEVSGRGHTIGGTGAGNVVFGLEDDGIALLTTRDVPSGHHRVIDNVIGSRPDGTPDAVGDKGVVVLASDNVIEGNEVLAHTNGIRVVDEISPEGIHTGAARNLVRSNVVSGSSHGIAVLGGDDNTVTRNRISGSGGAGVGVDHPTPVRVDPVAERTLVTENSIDGNAGLGIDRGEPGPGGPMPTITSARVNPRKLRISGTVDQPAPGSVVELYASPACDASGHGEGAVFLGAVPVPAGTGATPFTASVAKGPVAEGMVVSATLTDPAGGTAEFGPCAMVRYGAAE